MSKEILDLEDFLERVQNDSELLIELLDIFTNDFRIKRVELEAAFKNHDYPAIEHIAHFLKGSCSNISAGALKVIFSELEQKGRNRAVEEDTDCYLQEIDKRFDDLLRYFGEVRDKYK